MLYCHLLEVTTAVALCPLFITGIAMPYSNRRAPTEGKREKPRQPAKRYMVWLLSRQDYSAKALRDKLLSKEYPQEEIDAALAWVQEHGFQSDERYARIRADSTSRKHGNRRLTMGLQQKGIPKELAAAQLENLAPEEERVINVVSKFVGKELTQELRTKIYRFLATRGFSSKPIKVALQYLEERWKEREAEAGDDDDS